MAIRIRNDDTIQGFKFGEENVKLTLFADDMTCFLNDDGSYFSLFRLVDDFGECSGFKVNYEKTESSNLINHILLLGKYYIYSQKCQNA